MSWLDVKLVAPTAFCRRGDGQADDKNEMLIHDRLAHGSNCNTATLMSTPPEMIGNGCDFR